MSDSIFRISAHLALPDFEAERRYIYLETELARREMVAAHSRPWMRFKVRALNVYTAADWLKYLKALENYAIQLAKHRQEIKDGLIPVHFRATNDSSHDDAQVEIHISVSNGIIRQKKKPPKRPPRMDGAVNKADKVHFHWPTPGGFARRHLRLGSSKIDVAFSKLPAYDSAMVVRQVLYIETNKQTKLTYSVRSQNHRQGLQGMIKMPKYT